MHAIPTAHAQIFTRNEPVRVGRRCMLDECALVLWSVISAKKGGSLEGCFFRRPFFAEGSSGEGAIF